MNAAEVVKSEPARDSGPIVTRLAELRLLRVRQPNPFCSDGAPPQFNPRNSSDRVISRTCAIWRAVLTVMLIRPRSACYFTAIVTPGLLKIPSTTSVRGSTPVALSGITTVNCATPDTRSGACPA